MRRAQVLDLSSNLLSGSLPANLSELSLLKYLYLSQNQLTGGLKPHQFFALIDIFACKFVSSVTQIYL